jgi:sulfoxide reductase heme-binding subunit YedZ
MRLSATALVGIGAVAALIAIAATEQILPATDPRVADLRPWLAARALGVASYLLLCAQVALGLVLSHPRNAAAWKVSKPVFPWHELLTVFAGAFIALHVALLAVDPYADLGLLGSFVPGFSGYRPPAVALGTVALYALIVTTVTARWTRLLPPGAWLQIHRLSALAFLLTWMHAVLAGTDADALLPLYLATGLPILAGWAHRWWTRRVRTTRATGPATARKEPT